MLAEGLPKDNRFVTYTDWNGYLKFLEAIGDRRIRVTFDRGYLEIMTTNPEHEWMKKVTGALLEHLVVHLGVKMKCAGSMTFQRKELGRGLEPDECYWLAHADAFSLEYDPALDPPPDLVVEIDITRRSTRRMGIYRAMGVPEVWRYTRRKGLQVFQRNQAGQYEQCLSSPSFPQLPLAELRRHLDMANQGRDFTEILRSWQDCLGQRIP